MTTQKQKTYLIPLLWTVSGVLALGLMFARFVYPELVWLTVVLAVLLVLGLAGLIREHQVSLKSRSVAYGLNSAVTILLVIGIVGVLNFLASRYPKKWDLTKQGLHTLSDQTVKLIKGLQKPVKATLFQKIAARDKDKQVLDSYQALNPKFEIEYVDPDREPTRAKQVGIRKYGTLQLSVGGRDTKIEEVTEEKLTNALIKLMKEKTPTLCAITGHGEKSFSSTEGDGYDSAKKALVNQSYEIRELNLAQENKIPETCDALTILGPQKAFLAAEVKLLGDYLAAGGRAVIALDLSAANADPTRELTELLAPWHVRPAAGLVVDPLAKMFGAEADVPIVATYSKDSPITKDFQIQSFFPTTRAVEILENTPAGLNVAWLAQTNPRAVLVTDLAQLKSGQIRLDAPGNKQAAHNVAVAVEGKLPAKAGVTAANKSTRLVVFGSSRFAENQFARFGGGLDFFLNAASWAMEDEGMISIRAKDEEAGKVELSQKQGTFIFLFTVVALPLLIATAGIVIWAIRRRW